MKVSRRAFFTQVTGALAVGALVKTFPSTALAQTKRGARPGSDKGAGSGPLSFPLQDLNNPTAKAVNYVEDHANLKDAKLKIDRQGVKFEDQFCNNCSFYKEVGEKEGSKVGTCTIFPQKLVKAKAWCSSWNKKA